MVPFCYSRFAGRCPATYGRRYDNPASSLWVRAQPIQGQVRHACVWGTVVADRSQTAGLDDPAGAFVTTPTPTGIVEPLVPMAGVDDVGLVVSDVPRGTLI